MSTDFAAMRLKANGDAVRLAEILQMECRERCAVKLAETLRCPEFIFPTGLSAEQCTGDALAECHAKLVESGATVLDITCGLGIDAFHIARRASRVTAIDIEPGIIAAARHNAVALGLDNIEFIADDSIGWLTVNPDMKFDYIFADPARRGRAGERLFALTQCVPDIIESLGMLMSRCRYLVVKASPMLDVTQTAALLGHNADIIIYGTGGECKELTAVLPGNNRIIVNVDGTVVMEFTREMERKAVASVAGPDMGMWLHEPWPQIVKAGPFKLLSELYGLEALDVNTHLYIGNRPVRNFPGDVRRIEQVIPMGKQAVRELGGMEADVAVRNFVMSADELRRYLKIKRGGNGHRRIIGVRSKGLKLLIVLGDFQDL